MKRNYSHTFCTIFKFSFCSTFFWRAAYGVVIFCLFILLSHEAQGQCNVVVNAGPNQSSCALPEVFQLQGSLSNPAFPFRWSPATGLSSTTILNPTATISTPITYVLTGTAIDLSGDLITNGDFSAGNAGFVTDYTFDPNPVINANELDEGEYTVGSNPAIMHRNWQACGDHTTGNGNMLIVNGATFAGQNAWCQTISVTSNTDYAFSAWVVSVDPNGPVEIQFKIDGVPVGPGNVGLSTTCVWTNFFVVWNSGVSTSIEICIEDINIARTGNDFALDDITFSPLCEVTDEVTLSVSQVTATATSNSPLCELETLNLVGSGGGTYMWSGPQGFTSSDATPSIPAVTSAHAGTYTLTVTDANGCTDVTTTEVTIGRDTSITYVGTTCDPALQGATVQNYTNQSGCDSIVTSILTLLPTVNESVTATSCNPGDVGVTTTTFTAYNGCDSIVTTTTTLLPSVTENITETTCDLNAVGTSSMTFTAYNGCDSIVNTTSTLLPSSTENRSANTCDPNQVGVTTETFTAYNGCDSNIVTTTTLITIVRENISATTCDPTEVGVVGMTFISQAGCDSIVTITTTLIPEVTENYTVTTCDPNQQGVVTETFTSASGCDSIVTTTTVLLPTIRDSIELTTCNPTEAGEVTMVFIGQSGCDSIVTTTTTLEPSYTETVMVMTCDPAEVGVVTESFTSSGGCDSTVTTTTTLVPVINESVSVMSCDPADVGVVSETFISSSGCDSIITTITTLLPTITESVSAESCNPADVGVVTERFTSSSGCDSIVTTTTTLLPTITESVSAESCDPADVGVVNETFMSSSGCDSIVTTTTTLVPSITENISLLTCDSSEVGSVTETFTSQSGCDSLIITTTSLAPPNSCVLMATIVDDEIPCGESVGVLEFNISVGEPPFTYSYTGPSVGTGAIPGINVPTFLNNLTAGNYIIEVTSFDGRTILLSGSVVQLNPPEVNASSISASSNFDISCFGAYDGAAEVFIQGGTPPYSITWSTGDTTSLLSSLSEGTYFVTVEDAENCISTDSIQIIAPAEIQVDLVVTDLACFENSLGEVVVNTEGGYGQYQYSIENGEFQTGNVFSNLSAGGYSLSVLDENGCTAEEVLFVNPSTDVFVYIGEDQIIDFGDSVRLEAFVNVPYDSLAEIVWSVQDTFECQLCPTIAVAPFSATTYSVTVVSNEGCTASDDLTIRVDLPEIFAPTAFSPNGDGVNDAFTLFANPDFVSSIQTLLIFDRWGDHLARLDNLNPNDVAAGWDGRSGGHNLDPGVFVWVAVLELHDGSTETFKGDLTLVR